MAQKGPLSNTHQTNSEIETVLRQLAPSSESLAPPAESLPPASESPPPSEVINRARFEPGVINWARFEPGFRVLAVVAFLVLGGRCAYLQHKLSEVTNEVAVAKEKAGAWERRIQRPIPSEAADERGVRSDLEDASRRIRGVGRIHQTAPGVFTNRDTDPAEPRSR